MRDEEILRQILHEEARAVEPAGSFDDVVRRARRPRRLVPVAAAAAVAAAIVGAVSLVATQDEPDQVATGPDATDAPHTTSSAPAGPVPGDGGAGGSVPLDDRFVVAVVRQQGPEFDVHSVVVMDAGDGTVIRELASGDSVEGGILDVALTADRETVLYTLSTSACFSQQRAVSLADGTDTVIAEQTLVTPYRFAVHPRDGRIVVATDDDCDGQSELVVTSPAGAELGRWRDADPGATGADALSATIRSLAWVDDRTVALGMLYEDGVTTTLHDTTSQELLVGAGPQLDPGQGAASYDLPATTVADGTFGAVQVCCDLDASEAALVRIDGTGAEVERPVADASGPVAAVQWLGSTPLWVTETGVLRRLVDGAVVELARDVVDIAV